MLALERFLTCTYDSTNRLVSAGGHTYEVDFSERTSGGFYHHGYIRTIPTAVAVVTVCYCWQAVVGALVTRGAVGAPA